MNLKDNKSGSLEGLKDNEQVFLETLKDNEQGLIEAIKDNEQCSVEILKDNEQGSLETLLFFGSLKQETYLTPITLSQYYQHSTQKLIQLQSPQTRFESLITRFPMDFLGIEYKSLYLPCTPAHEITLLTPEAQLSNCDPNSNELLKLGLMKTSKKTNIKGYRSGKRSAIYYDKTEKTFYRLKGCGNMESGFISSTGRVSLDPQSKEIRGSHYSHTVKRELLMTEIIDGFLKEIGMESGNKPIGFWLYNEDTITKDETLSNAFPKISKYCGVFRTLGEKRVATHLFQGLEALLAEFIRIVDDCKEIEKVFPKERTLKDGEFIKTPVDLEATFDINIGVIAKEDPLIDIFALLDEKKLSLVLKEDNNYMKNIPIIIENLKIDNNYKGLFESILIDLMKNQTDILSLYAILYSRIGYEIGRIKRLFFEKQINWGYYFDHHPYLAHCNAHPNNFIVLPEDHVNKENILAPLDFDLAFEKPEFMSIDYQKPSYGEYDAEEWQNFLNSERISLEMALTGIENMENFEYYSIKGCKLEGDKEKYFEGIKIIYRDCLRKAYLKGMEKGGEFDKLFKREEIYKIIKLALIVTNDCMG